MFGIGIFDALKIGAGAALGALVASGPAYLYGADTGRQQAAVAALETSVKVLRKRNQIDAAISAGDAASLCADLGLSVDDATECVRRLATPDASLETSVMILKTVRPFSNQVAAHNRFGKSQGCWK